MDELAHAKELLNKHRFNLLIMLGFSLTTLGVVVWAFLNQNSDSLLQKAFFIVVGAASAFGLYLRYVQDSQFPFPKGPTNENLKEYQLGVCRFNFRNIKTYIWGSLAPNYIGLMGILAMEFTQGKFIILFLFALFIFFVFFLARSFHMEKFYDDTYERITGKRHLHF